MVGGGIVGASALYHLTAAGCRDVVLVERDTLGSGSTGAAAGGIRAQFSDELNIRIALECIERFGRFEDEVGGEIDFRQTGYLFLLREHEVDTFAASVALQRSLGAPSRMLTLEEAAAIVPGLRLDDLAAATFNPTDGCANPGAVVQAYADAARRHGARVLQATTALRVIADSGRVTGVETPGGVIRTPVVICAAGVWSRELAATAGVDIPVRPEQRYVYFTGQRDDLPAALPLTVDFATGFYFHREGPGLLMGGPWDDVEGLATVALHRLPACADLPIRRGWAGAYEMSPDHNGIVGGVDDPEGFLYATGFSGHGFQQGPVVGEYLADLALGREPLLDLSPLSLDRFSGGGLRQEGNVI